MQSRGNLDRLEDWYNVILMKFNTAKGKPLFWIGQIPNITTDWGMDGLGAVMLRKELGILVDIMSADKVHLQDRKPIISLAHENNYGSQLREEILSLYSTLVRCLLECCIQLWGTQDIKTWIS